MKIIATLCIKLGTAFTLFALTLFVLDKTFPYWSLLFSYDTWEAHADLVGYGIVIVAMVVWAINSVVMELNQRRVYEYTLSIAHVTARMSLRRYQQER